MRMLSRYRRQGLVGVMIMGMSLLIPAQAHGAPAGDSRRPVRTSLDIHPAGFTSSSASDVNNRGQVIGTAVRVVDSEIGPPLGFVWHHGVRTWLSPLRGGRGSLPRDINAGGDVAGFCETATGGPRPCLWHHGRPRDLGTLDGRGTGTALALNDKGEVVGECETFLRGGQTRAFIWRRGVLTDLGGVGDRVALGINNRSQVIGSRYTSGGPRGFLWRRGALTDLGTLGGDESAVSDINDRGQIVGSSTTATGSRRAFLWQRGRMVNLGTLPGGTDSAAVAVNERGQIVGWSTTAGGANHAVLWQRGVLTDLGVLSRGGGSVAADINERGRVVGSSWDANGSRHRVFIWQRGRMIPVGTSAQGLSEVLAVNDKGLMAGWTTGTGPDHATVWQVRRT